ncbi:MAG: hypothetical protein IKN05_05525 [Clostridia bacterium]|nr:hypothetical protein [Clostridia bacterium]
MLHKHPGEIGIVEIRRIVRGKAEGVGVVAGGAGVLMTLPLDVSVLVPMAQGAPLICSVVIWSMKAKYFLDK